MLFIAARIKDTFVRDFFVINFILTVCKRENIELVIASALRILVILDVLALDVPAFYRRAIDFLVSIEIPAIHSAWNFRSRVCVGGEFDIEEEEGMKGKKREGATDWEKEEAMIG